MTPLNPSALNSYSIEVLPRSLARTESLRELLPAGTRVYVAHVEGTAFEDVLAATRRIQDEGFSAMPHIPARLIPDSQALSRWVGRLREEGGATQALVLAGGIATPKGPYASSMQLLETGVFERHGFERLHLAAHPEGNRDIDPDGSSSVADQALLWKQAYANRTSAQLALVTQFGFETRPLLSWCERITRLGVSLPVHVGLAGPARLQTLLKYALACGAGPSLKLLQRRARNLSRLLLPYEPGDMLTDLQAHKRLNPASPLTQVHVFAFGGLPQASQWFNTCLGLVPAKARAEASCLK
jgi:methylenetetrahydrofolate reductase (NADPH)